MIVSVDGVPGVTEGGESVTTVPVGPQEMPQDKLTEELNPFIAVTEMIEVPWLPRDTVRLVGDALRLKLGVPPAASVIVVAVEVELW